MLTTMALLNDRYLLTGGDDNSIKVWDLTNSLIVDELNSHENTVSCIHVTDNFIYSGSYDHNILKWDKKDLLKRIEEK
jgi:WD40 repeat protein